MRERRAKGLCFNCDERYSQGHLCKAQKFYYLEALEEEEGGVEDTKMNREEQHTIDSPVTPIITPPLEISLHALVGAQVYPQTMCVKGKINGREVNILIDTGLPITI